MKKFLKFSMILGLDSKSDRINSKTILNRILWNFTPNKSYKLWIRSTFSNNLVWFL